MSAQSVPVELIEAVEETQVDVKVVEEDTAKGDEDDKHNDQQDQNDQHSDDNDKTNDDKDDDGKNAEESTATTTQDDDFDAEYKTPTKFEFSVYNPKVETDDKQVDDKKDNHKTRGGRYPKGWLNSLFNRKKSNKQTEKDKVDN